MPNRLAGSKSPYLLQHAGNPVDWQPWGDEAVQEAVARDKPLLVSIGYSACHWCHVMAHESFENVSIARLMNDNFVNIKVDREERPDVDAVYMEALQIMSGQGGWPLNVFLTPDLKPFFGGTYFPPAPGHGMPSWPQVLQSVVLAWQRERHRLEESAASLVNQMARSNDLQQSREPLSASVLDDAFHTVSSHFDSQNGGFGGAPKFPQPLSLEFLLRTYVRTNDIRALEVVTTTLDRMSAGGIYDQLGGGFHRYSVDETWSVPHFEKMLYDNALLSRLYLLAWQVTGSASYRRTAEEILDYVLRDMTSPEGGFYSSEDADSEGREGTFYVWSPHQIDAVLDERASRLFKCRYGVTPAGNFEGATVLAIASSFEEIVTETGLDPDEVIDSVESSKQRLLVARDRRPTPGRDGKILTDWNALMLRSFALAGRALERPDYLAAACRNADFLLENLMVNGRLVHVFNQGPGSGPGYLDDHAFLLEALITTFETTGESRYLIAAKNLASTLIADFPDEQGGFFTVSANGAAGLPVRPKSLFDSVTPSGNSSAAMGLLLLSALTGEQSLQDPAVGTIRLLLRALGTHGSSFGYMACALDYHLARKAEIVIVGPLDTDSGRALTQTVYSRYLPNTISVLADPGRGALADIPLLRDKQALGGDATAFVCENYSCRLPITDPAALAQQLSPSL